MSIPTPPQDDLHFLALINTSPTDVEGTLVGPDGFGYTDTFHVAMQSVAVVGNWIVAVTDALVTTSNASIGDIVALTQAEYDALLSKDATTLYVIKAAS